VGGKKMSTSRPEEWKELGAAAHELVGLYPPELVRFLMLRTHPKRHIDFDPTGMNLPKLVDEYDRCADAYVAAPDSDFGKTWSLSQVSEDHGGPGFRVRFSIVADWLQIPSVDPLREAERRKAASLTGGERRELERRIELAREWLRRWAPADARYTVLGDLPSDIALSADQRRYLAEVRTLVGSTTDAEQMQQSLYEAAKRVGLTSNGGVSRDAFSAIYQVFIGRANGPRAGWLLTTLKDDFVRKRLDEAVRSG
jgi:lysyl-tRNA synthetase class 1